MRGSQRGARVRAIGDVIGGAEGAICGVEGARVGTERLYRIDIDALVSVRLVNGEHLFDSWH